MVDVAIFAIADPEVLSPVLSYRHAFHAGNVADVHKHCAWLAGIRALLKKPAPFCLLDAYAGAGAYRLDSDMARRTGEWQRGVARLFETPALPAALADYRDAVAEFNGDQLAHYPGSPMLAARELRENDRLVCLELHPADHPALKALFAADARVHVHRRDAREGLPALLPPAERRGLVLIDPPYEQAAEYEDVAEALRAAWRRWPTGGYLLWYPLLANAPHLPMIGTLADGEIRKLFVQEIELFPQASGLRGSGIAWINPPWQAEAALTEAGEWMVRQLGDQGALQHAHWRVPE